MVKWERIFWTFLVGLQ